MHIIKSLISNDVEYVITSRDVEILKHKARQLKRDKGISHHQALDLVAKNTGYFSHWHHFTQCAKAIEPVETACYSGCIFAMDTKEAQDIEFGDLFIEDRRIPLVFEKALFDWFSALPDAFDPDRRPLKKTSTADELREDFETDMGYYVFYRVSETVEVSDINQLFEWILQESMWLPRDVWLHGKHRAPLQALR